MRLLLTDEFHLKNKRYNYSNWNEHRTSIYIWNKISNKTPILSQHEITQFQFFFTKIIRPNFTHYLQHPISLKTPILNTHPKIFNFPFHSHTIFSLYTRSKRTPTTLKTVDSFVRLVSRVHIREIPSNRANRRYFRVQRKISLWTWFELGKRTETE